MSWLASRKASIALTRAHQEAAVPVRGDLDMGPLQDLHVHRAKPGFQRDQDTPPDDRCGITGRCSMPIGPIPIS